MTIVQTCTRVEIHRAAGQPDFIRYEQGSHCPVCGKRVRNPQAQKVARQQALDIAGHRCTYKDADGNQCAETTELEAAHIVPLAKGGSYDTVTILCRRHHRKFDRQRSTVHDDDDVSRYVGRRR